MITFTNKNWYELAGLMVIAFGRNIEDWPEIRVTQDDDDTELIEIGDCEDCLIAIATYMDEYPNPHQRYIALEGQSDPGGYLQPPNFEWVEIETTDTRNFHQAALQALLYYEEKLDDILGEPEDAYLATRDYDPGDIDYI